MEREEPAMSAADFAAWMAAEQLSLRGAQAALGIGSRNSLLKYLAEGAPLTVALACRAVSAKLPPWTPGS